MKNVKNEKMRILRTVPNFLNLIYPPVCGVCGKLCDDFVCKKCNNMLKKQADFKADKFNNSYKNKIDIINNNKYQEKNFDEHLYIFKYEGIIRKMLLKYKFQDKSYLYKTFVNFLLKDEKLFEILEKYDTIIPVPISKKREKQRGYNQSGLIAKEIAKLTSLKYEDTCLLKIKDIIEQSKLNKEERILNIQDVYELRNEYEILHKKIILLDDIYTTGSTVNECCRILKKAKPMKIGVLTIAKD